MNMIDKARIELIEAGYKGDSLESYVKIVEVFCELGHSGGSAPFGIEIVRRLLLQHPLSHLTGEESEWGKPSFDGSQQNKRLTSVFRYNEDNSTAIYLDGKVFSDDGGETWFTNRNSRIPIKFPFYPKEPERILLEEER